MKHRITATLLLLVLSSADAFSTATRSNLFRTTSTQTFQKKTVPNNAFESSRPTTELRMSTVPVAAITGALTGGLFAGGLHAIAGKSTLENFFSHHEFRIVTTDRLPST